MNEPRRSYRHATTFVAVFGITVITALALASVGIETDASHICTDTGSGLGSSNGKCGAASFTIDMQDAGNTASGLPVGHSETLGTVETCVQINENGLLDADEDSIDAVFVDVTVLNIPANPPSPHDRTGAIGFSYLIQYDALNLTITTQDPNFILVANPGSSLLDVSDAVPDNNADNVWAANVLDTNSSDPEEGSGVLQRIAVETEASAATALYSIAIEDLGTPASGSAYTIDPDNDPQYPDAIAGGSLAVNDTCLNLTPTPSPAPTPTPTATPTPSPTATPSPTPTPTPTPSPTPTPCSSNCPTPVPTPVPGNPIAVDSDWVGFDWISSGLPFAAQGPFTFESPNTVIVRITDAACKGDRFRLFDFESAVGDTPLVPKGPCPDPTASVDPDVTFADPTYSHGEFVLAPGPHYLDIRVIANLFNSGRGFIRVDSVKTTPTPTLAPGIHDAGLERLDAPAVAHLLPGLADTKASPTTIVVRNEGDHSEPVAVYLALVPPPGATNPAGCSALGVVDMGIFTLKAGQKTTLRLAPQWSCENPAEVNGLAWALKAVADIHADDEASCATVDQMFSGECSAALADDDLDDSDNVTMQSSPRVVAVTP